MTKTALVLALGLAVFASNPAYAAIAWTNLLGGNWSDSSNWNPNQVPGTSDDVVITNTGTITVTLDVSATVNSLRLGGNSGQQTLAMAGNNLTVNNDSQVQSHGRLQLDGGSLGGVGGLTIQGQLNWSGGRLDVGSRLQVATNGSVVANAGAVGNLLEFLGVLTNRGTIFITNGSLRCLDYIGDGGGYGLLVNAPGGLIDLGSGATIDSYNDNTGTGLPMVVNYGTVRKSSGTDTNWINPPFYNFGTLDVQTGVLNLNGGGSGNGIFRAEAGATLDYLSSYEVDGTMSGPGTNLLASSILTFDGTLTGQLLWTGGLISPNSNGRIETNGWLLVSGGVGNQLDFLGVLTNSGTIVVTDSNLRCIDWTSEGGGYGLLVNAASGLIDLQQGSTIDFYNDNTGVGTPTVINYGLVRKSSGNDISPINVSFYNSGSLEVQVGAVGLNGGGAGSGVFQTEAGSTLGFGAGYEVDSALTGAGSNAITHGNFILNGLLATANALVSGDAILGGTNGVIADQLTWAGGQIGAGSVLTVATNGQLIVNAGAAGVDLDFLGVLTNRGSIVVTNGSLRCIDYTGEGGGFGLLVNATGGLIALQNGSGIDFYNDNTGLGTPAVVNYGTVRKTDGQDTNLISAPFYNLGSLDVQSGIVSLNGDYDLTGGTLNFGLNSPADYGQLQLTGTAALTGTLSANANHGFVPIRGQAFSVITYGAQTGSFDNFALPTREVWSTNYDVNTFTLTVLNSAPTLPPQTNRVVYEETSLMVANTATDLDLPPDALTYSLLSAPTGVTISANGMIAWTPTEAQGPATNTIITRVMDSGNPRMSATNIFTVVVNEVNVAPVLPLQLNRVINELTTLIVTNTAADHDIPVNPLTYTLLTAPTNAAIDSQGIISWTPTEAQGPSTNLFVTVVTDTNVYAVNAKSLSATNLFIVVVDEMNVAPVLTVPANATISELTIYTNNATATDVDIPANPLTFSLISGPTGLVVSPAGAISWMPSEAQGPSTNLVQIAVTDFNPWAVNAQRLSATNSFYVTVNEVNSAPVLGQLNNFTVNAGQIVSFTASATDTDIPTNSLTFTLISAPSGATINASSGLFNWRPAVAQADTTNAVQVQVTDYNPYAVNQQHLSDTKSFTIVVKPLAPVILTTLGHTNGQFQFQASGTAGPDYIIEASADLLGWVELETNISPALPLQYTDSAHATNHFFRVRLAP